MCLTERVAVVTGGSSGIGQASARLLARRGARVMIADRDEAGGAETIAMIAKEGGEAAFAMTDVTVFAEVESAVADAVTRWGRLDIMLNNAGVSHYLPLLEQTPETFSAVLETNQCGVFYGILASGREMVKAGRGGCIINMVSVYAYTASPGLISYHASKAAVSAMTKSAALELAPHGIRVVGVAPGGVDTPMVQKYKDAGMARQLAKRHMRGALLTADQIAEVVAFLASDGAHAINGTTVMADDGFVGFK